MKIKIFPIILIIVFAIIFLIFYRGLQNSNIYTPNVQIKKDIPSFEGKVFDSETITKSEKIFLENKFYLVNIWASWCIPCIEEHSFLVDLSKKQNLEIIGINYKDKNENAKIFLDKFDSPFELIIEDYDGTIAIEWGAFGVPETFLIFDKKIIKKIIGPLNNDLSLQIQELIK